MPGCSFKKYFDPGAVVAAFRRRRDARSIERIAKLSPLRTVRVGDIDIAYREFGRGEPLVMITAFSTFMDMWDARFILRLAARYRVVIFDNRGMGRTGTGTAPWSVGRFASDTAGFIRALGWERAHVLGWSLGGDIALCLAVESPGVVESLTVYAGDCGGPHKVAAPRYHDVLRRVFRFGYVPFGVSLSILFPPAWMRKHPDFWRTVPLSWQRFRPWRVARQNRAYEEWPGVYEELGGIACPVLLVTGAEDVSTPPANAEILAARIPGARLVKFRGAGHGLMYQFPDELAGTVIGFLETTGERAVGPPHA